MVGRNVSLLILYNSEGKILLQHRDKDAARLPDYWGFFGGGIEPKENSEDAMKREISEELGYEAKNYIHLTTQKFTYRESENTKYVFIEKYNNQPLVLMEGQSMDWFLPVETKTLKMIDHDRPIIEEIDKFLRSDKSFNKLA